MKEKIKTLKEFVNENSSKAINLETIVYAIKRASNINDKNILINNNITGERTYPNDTHEPLTGITINCILDVISLKINIKLNTNITFETGLIDKKKTYSYINNLNMFINKNLVTNDLTEIDNVLYAISDINTLIPKLHNDLTLVTRIINELKKIKY